MRGSSIRPDRNISESIVYRPAGGAGIFSRQSGSCGWALNEYGCYNLSNRSTTPFNYRPTVMKHNPIYLFSIFALTGIIAADEFPNFKAHMIDPYVGEICYAVTVADVDGDTKVDIVAVSERAVYWYENPSWTRHVIIQDQTERDNVCIAPFDVDKDGKVEFALGAGWTKIGTIQLLSRGQTLDDPWQVHPIGREPWLHRMRFADVLGTGIPQLVVSPLNKTDGQGVRLTAYEIPTAPLTDRWMPTILDQNLNRMHNHWHADVDGDSRFDTLTASQEGIHLIQRNGQHWNTTKIAAGANGMTAEVQGAGEIKLGRLGDGRQFISTVEPMHGKMVVVYTQQNDKTWQRKVIDDTLKRGHAVWLADFDKDGSDEIVVGHSDPGEGSIKGPGIYVYDAHDKHGDAWQKHVIDDGGIATEDAIAADVTGDGWIDIVAGGRATHNLKLYVHPGK